MKYICIFCGVMLVCMCVIAHSTSAAWAKDTQHALTGKASWYGDKFHGKQTASGAFYNMHSDTAAHRTLPFGTVVEVQGKNSPQTVLVCITDRGPFIRGRVIDLSRTAGEKFALMQKGITSVQLRVVSDAQGKILDEKKAFFVCIYNKHTKQEEHIGPYTHFADASAVKGALRTVYPQAFIAVR